MPNIRAMRLLNALVAGSVTGSQLQTLLSGDGGLLAEWNILLDRRGQANRLAGSSAAMTALAASNTAVDALVGSANAMKSVASSSAAMAVAAASSPIMAAIAASGVLMQTIAASSAAMAAVVASSVAKMAVFNSDTALNAIAASARAMAACRAAAQYSVVSWTENGATAVALTLTGTSHIVMGASRSTIALRTVTLTTVRSGSAVSAITPSIGVAALTTGAEVNCAIPIVSTRTAKLSGTGSGTCYLGILRCDA